MVAKITVPNCIRRALNYNEQKVNDGKAECLYAHQFLQPACNMNFYEKLQRFQSLISLNQRAATNCIHISLNFGLQEEIKQEKLIEIASVYMDKIGFEGQPYLVYKHLDAGHPHIHIVSTNIQKDGKRISLHNLGRNQSNTARKEIEIVYNLQKAEAQKHLACEEIKPLDARRLTYGKSATKRSITNVLDAVLPRYKYSSLAELNAVLRLYNVTADRGSEEGMIYRHHGLMYRALDEKGMKVGVPIKASSIYSKPTLPYLGKRFAENEEQKAVYKRRLKTSIDWIMSKPPKSFDDFKRALEKEQVALLVRQNDAGVIYGLTYIDHKTKCVFNGSDIGKGYSAKGILEKCGVVEQFKATQNSSGPVAADDLPTVKSQGMSQRNLVEIPPLLKDLITPMEDLQFVPHEFKRRLRKKRKKH